MKIGVMLDSFRLGFAEAARAAASLGADGVQIYAVTGDFCPTMPKERKEECRRILRENGLVVSALCGDLGGHGFQIEKDNPARVEKTKAIMDMALEFDTHVVTTHIGCVPADKTDPQYAVMLAALRELGEYGDKIGVSLAIETGPEPTAVLAEFLADLPKSVDVNFDPANLVMVTRDDPVAGVKNLTGRIVHTHVKDGVCLRPTDPRKVYATFAEGGIECEQLSEYFRETPLGEGDVPMDAYLDALRASGYDGFLTVEREAGDDPYADIKLAVDYLKNKLGR